MTSSRWEDFGGVARSEAFTAGHCGCYPGAALIPLVPGQEQCGIIEPPRSVRRPCSLARALVLQVIAENHNVCNQLHMPAQSGASSTLQRMRRGYTREAYDALVQHARDVIPGVALSTDIITGKSASSHT